MCPNGWPKGNFVTLPHCFNAFEMAKFSVIFASLKTFGQVKFIEECDEERLSKSCHFHIVKEMVLSRKEFLKWSPVTPLFPGSPFYMS